MKHFNLIDKAFLLKRTPLFSMLDLDLLLTIADKLTLATFDSGEFVFHCDQDGHRMYFIAKGKVRIRDRHKQTLAVIGPDDFFGDESLFHDRPRTYEALCDIDSVLLTLSRTHLATIISECPSVAIGFLQVYSSAMNFRIRKSPEVF